MRITLTLFAATLLLMSGCDTSTNTSSKSVKDDAHTVARPSYSDSSTATPVEPDNTAVNERDRNREAKTPFDQNENQRDISITADIRKAVLAEKDMSINARNVKIITADGKVTLRGPVNSDEERKVVDGIAHRIAGKDNVTNEIEVKAQK